MIRCLSCLVFRQEGGHNYCAAVFIRGMGISLFHRIWHLPPASIQPLRALFRAPLGHPVNGAVPRKFANAVFYEASYLPWNGIGASKTLDELLSSLGRWLYQVSVL